MHSVRTLGERSTSKGMNMGAGTALLDVLVVNSPDQQVLGDAEATRHARSSVPLTSNKALFNLCDASIYGQLTTIDRTGVAGPKKRAADMVLSGSPS
jgi:hypothetical protein